MPAYQSSYGSLTTTLAALEKKYGKGTVMELGTSEVVETPAISTGSISLDRALGVGGFPKGRIVEIYGPEASGKTTLALHAVAQTQQKGGKALIIDTEHAFDAGYARKLGVNVEKLLICQPNYGEQALDVAQQCIASGEIDLVLVDSVSALLPEAELKGNMGDHHVGGQARLMSQAMRKLTSLIHKTGAICIFINQIRHKVGVFFGSPETTSGGNALKFYASVRLDIRRVGQLKDTENNIIGQSVKVKVVKNKVAPPFKEVFFDILYGEGISTTGEVIDLALNLQLLEKKGAWYSYHGTQLAQGKEGLRAFLENHPEVRAELLEAIKSAAPR